MIWLQDTDFTLHLGERDFLKLWKAAKTERDVALEKLAVYLERELA